MEVKTIIIKIGSEVNINIFHNLINLIDSLDISYNVSEIDDRSFELIVYI